MKKTQTGNKKIFFITITAVILIMFSIFLFYNKNHNGKTLCIEDKKCFKVEIADDPYEMERGLSGRQALEENFGMLFIFPNSTKPGFWMKEMNFALDIIWIDENWKILGIEKDLPPCANDSCSFVYPLKEIKYVLEVNSGLSETYGFLEGDSITFEK